MKKLLTLTGSLLLGGLVLLQAPVVPAQVSDVRPDAAVDSPERIANRCIARAEKLGNACSRAVVKTTKRCIRVVNRLVEAGRLDRAARVAERCAERITSKAERCTDKIESHCVRCVNYLDDIGEPDLAERVKEACSKIIENLVDLVERALNAIADALAGGAGDFDDSL